MIPANTMSRFENQVGPYFFWFEQHPDGTMEVHGAASIEKAESLTDKMVFVRWGKQGNRSTPLPVLRKP